MIEKTFAIGIECRNPLFPEDIDYSEYDFDEELDSVTGMFYSLSESFYQREILLYLKICEHNCINFSVELSILLEDFHRFVYFVNNDEEKEYRLHFYEQGADRFLSFNKIKDGEYSLIFDDRSILGFECLSTTGTVLDLNLMLFILFSKVCFLANKMCPSIVNSPMYTAWNSDIRKIFNLQE